MRKNIIIIGIMIILISIFSYAKISSSSLNFLTRGEALTLFETKSGSNDFDIYFNHSIKSTINYNLTESDESNISISTTSGEKFIFGGTFE